MISSFIWLFLVHVGAINPDRAPWSIYLPICLLEVIVYFRYLFKWGENDKSRTTNLDE